MDKELPHSIDSEKIVLGSIMTDINALSEVSVILKPDMFYLTTHRGIYDAMLNLTRKGKAPDMVMLTDQFRGDTKMVHDIIDLSDYFSIDYYQHALNVQEKFVRRRLWMIGTKLATDVHSNEETTDLLYSLQGELSQIGTEVSSTEVFRLSDAIREVYKQIENNLKGDYLTRHRYWFIRDQQGIRRDCKKRPDHRCG